jgi:hypothetical protein
VSRPRGTPRACAWCEKKTTRRECCGGSCARALQRARHEQLAVRFVSLSQTDGCTVAAYDVAGHVWEQSVQAVGHSAVREVMRRVFEHCAKCELDPINLARR